METESWTEYRVYLIRTLERLEGLIRDGNARLDTFKSDGSKEVAMLRAEINRLEIEFGMQKVKMGIISALSSMVTGAIVAAIVGYLMKGH